MAARCASAATGGPAYTAENHLGRVALPLINYCFDDVLLKRHQGAESAA